MVTASNSRKSPEDLERLGTEILRRHIEPAVSPGDSGKFVAIAVDNEDYEIHENDHTAVSRLLDRHPTADVWLARIGYRTTYRLGRNR